MFGLADGQEVGTMPKKSTKTRIRMSEANNMGAGSITVA